MVIVSNDVVVLMTCDGHDVAAGAVPVGKVNVVPLKGGDILLGPLTRPPVLSAMEEPVPEGVGIEKGWYEGILRVCTTGGRLLTIWDWEIVVPDRGLPVNEAVKERV